MVQIHIVLQKTPEVRHKDRRKYVTQAAITSYEKVEVDAIASSSESEGPDEDVHHIFNDEVSDDNEEHLSDGEETNEDQ